MDKLLENVKRELRPVLDRIVADLEIVNGAMRQVPRRKGIPRTARCEGYFVSGYGVGQREVVSLNYTGIDGKRRHIQISQFEDGK